jgi:hypothetical protein
MLCERFAIVMQRRNYFVMALVVVIGIGIAVAFRELRMARHSGIVGTWEGDLTAAFTQVYSKHGIIARNARSVVTFNADGTYTSEDSATLVATTGPHKGESAPYHAASSGKFSFSGKIGSIEEMSGDRPASVTLPQNVRLKLITDSKLAIVEDYGARGRLEYTLHRRE